jgi:uncharacterized protein YraI
MFRFVLFAFIATFFSSTCVAEEVPLVVRVTVLGSGIVSVRSEPNEGSSRLAALKNGEYVANFGCSKLTPTAPVSSASWCKVRVPSRAGWIPKRFLAQQSDPSSFEIVGASPDSGVDVRREPSVSSQQVFVLPLGVSNVRLSKCKESGGEAWCEVYVEKLVGWVSSQFLDLRQPAIADTEKQVDFGSLYGDWSRSKGCTEEFERYLASAEVITYKRGVEGLLKEFGRGTVRVERSRNEICFGNGYEFDTCAHPEVLSRRYFKARWTDLEYDEEPDEEISVLYRCARIPSDDFLGNEKKLSVMEIPSVGCASESMAEDRGQVPSVEPFRVRMLAAKAEKLSYYTASNGLSVLAPRGWSCLGSSGTNGKRLLVMPTKEQVEKYWSASSSDRGWAGAWPEAVVVSSVTDRASGSHLVARYSAALFPGLARNGNKWRDLDGTIRVESYPFDHLVKIDGFDAVEYETPAGVSGAGTVLNDLGSSSDPIVGAAFYEKDGGLTTISSVAVRLAPSNIHLSSSIVGQFEEVRKAGSGTGSTSDGSSVPTSAPISRHDVTASWNWKDAAEPLGGAIFLILVFVLGVVLLLREASSPMLRVFGLAFVLAAVVILALQTEPIGVGLYSVDGIYIANSLILLACIVTIWLGISGRLLGRLRAVAVSTAVVLLVLMLAPLFNLLRPEGAGTGAEGRAVSSGVTQPGDEVARSALQYSKGACASMFTVQFLADLVRHPEVGDQELMRLTAQVAQYSKEVEALRLKLIVNFGVSGGRVRLWRMLGDGKAMFVWDQSVAKGEGPKLAFERLVGMCGADSAKYFGPNGAFGVSIEDVPMSYSSPGYIHAIVADDCKAALRSASGSDPARGAIQAAESVCRSGSEEVRRALRFNPASRSTAESQWEACKMVASVCYAD